METIGVEQTGEVDLWNTKRSLTYFFPTIFSIILALLIAIFFHYLLPYYINMDTEVGQFLTKYKVPAIVSALASFYVVFGSIRYVYKLLYFEYGLDGEHVWKEKGILTTTRVSVPISEIRDTTVVRPLQGRFLGYGTLRIGAAGDRDELKMNGHPEPGDWADFINDRRTEMRTGEDKAQGDYQEVDQPSDPSLPNNGTETVKSTGANSNATAMENENTIGDGENKQPDDEDESDDDDSRPPLP